MSLYKQIQDAYMLQIENEILRTIWGDEGRGLTLDELLGAIDEELDNSGVE